MNHRRIKCGRCDGHGQVAGYGAFGLDFEGPEECHDCGGSGTIVEYPSGALAQYPGGPFLSGPTRRPSAEVSP